MIGSRGVRVSIRFYARECGCCPGVLGLELVGQAFSRPVRRKAGKNAGPAKLTLSPDRIAA